MIITMMKPVTVDIKPGDNVKLYFDSYGGFGVVASVRRITVRNGMTYVVFDNNTWRPMSTYGRTWEKIEA